VFSLWEMRIPAVGQKRVRILPNACVDLVLYVSSTSAGQGDASLIQPPHRSFVVGSTLRSFIVQSVGWRHVIGASLRPAAVQPLLGLPASEIGQSLALLHDVIGPKAGEIEDRVFSGPAEGALRRLAEALLAIRTPDRSDGVARRAEQLVRKAHGRQRIDDLASEVNVSGRGLERRFLKEVGITPKLFSRLVRFDKAVRDLGGRGQRPWSQFALEHGYTDQAHFINEFKEFAGVTPVEFEQESVDNA
jgi:AraC-like DNA-binding protein